MSSHYMNAAEINLDFENQHPLPLRVGQSMVNTLHLVNNEFNEIMAETVYGKKPLVWELFCGPQSQLTTSCLENGLETMRINLASGFDLYKDETWDKLYMDYMIVTDLKSSGSALAAPTSATGLTSTTVIALKFCRSIFEKNDAC